VVDNLVFDIEALQKQIAVLQGHIGNATLQKEDLLSTCSSLLAVYNQLIKAGNGQVIDAQPENAPPSPSLQKALQILIDSQHELNTVEARYRAVVESDSIFICRMLPDGAITYANQSLERCLNLLRYDQQLQNFLDNLDKSLADGWRQNISTLSKERPEFTLTHPIQLPGAQHRWHQWNCQGFFNPQGRLVEIQAIGHDITALKQAEIAAEQHNRELSALHTATRALLSILDTETLLGQILDAAIAALPVAQKGTLHLIARDTGQLELRASIGYADPRIKKFSYSESSGYVARAVRERRPLIIHDATVEIPNPRRELIPEMSSIQSALVAPLIMNDRVLGAVSLESSVPAAFSQSDLHLLESIAATATNAILNAELHAQVQKLAITDALTGLYNRRGFYELGEREIERSFRFNHPLTAIMMDVDYLKKINDIHGHFTGDHVLRNIATRCGKQLRKIDILGRYGGDEFIVLLPETPMRMGSLVAERLRRCVADVRIPRENELIQTSISLGVAGLTTEITNLDTLIKRADTAMYAAKQSGRNQVMAI
jgi:diguanylate cyclase (GGDEF)-like protein